MNNNYIYTTMIQITLKTLKNELHSVSFDENETFETQVDIVRNATGLTENDWVKLLHAGKILDLAKTPLANGVKNGDAIVVMKTKKVVPVALVAAPAPAPAPAPVSAPETSESASASTSVVPAQVQPAPMVDVWLQPDQADTTASYSIEQAHVILPMIFSYITQNPNLRLLLLTNPSILNEVLVGQGFRTVVRQLLQQSPSLLNSIRTGAPASVVIGQPPAGSGTTQASSAGGTGIPSLDQLMPANFNMDYYDGEEDEEDHSGHDHSHEGHDHDHGHSHSHGAVAGTGATATSLSTEDQQNIAQLMEITGSQFPMAKQAYESSGKNMEIAGSLLMQLMFN
jgi:hypothetical protein